MSFHGRPGVSFVIMLISISFSAFGQVYYENFTGEANGATSGTAVGGTWTTTSPSSGGGSFCRVDVGAPYGGIIRVENTGTEGVWRSNTLNISALGEVALEVLMGGNNATPADYVRAYYVIDGGAEVMFAEVLGAGGLVVFTASSAVVSGSTLQIVIRGMDNSGGGGLMGFDDITVTDISTLYSRANTAWNLGTTWSTAGLGGASCGCTPNTDTKVVIGNGNTVTFTADGTSAGIEIRNTGTLQWTANNLDLAVARGGAVDIQSGGTLTRVATTASTLQFGNYTYNVNVAGTLLIGALGFSGSGNSILTNSGTVTLGTSPGLIINGGNGYTFNNSGTFTLGAMDLNGADITFNNSGTVNQTGNFTDVDAGSTFNNLANGTWNFGGTVSTGVRLFANNNSNTFNYNSAAGQNIITPQDAYSNLTLSGGGAKIALASFSVNGNWTRSGTATFTPGASRVTLNGSIPQSISAAGAGETFSNLTINNSSATSPQITLNNNVTISTNLTMTDGNVNLNGYTFSITPTAAGLTHTQLPAAGWMYGGNFARAFATSAVAVGNINGFYPLGGSADFRPFLISKNGVIMNSNGTITIAYTDASTATDITFTDGAATIQRRHDSFWTLSKTGATAGTWAISAGGTGFTIGAVNQTRLTRASDALNIGTAAASGGSPADVRANRTGLTAAQLVNSFYIASTDKVATPLPIDLLYFRAHLQGDEVVTTWKTAQEKDNHYFTVEKTVDFETFFEAGRLEGQGSSSEEHSYSFVDDSPFTGRSYYRLKQTDFDGAFTVSAPVMIDYSGAPTPLLKVYPNPFTGKDFTIELKGVTGLASVTVHLYNQQGQKVLEIPVDEEGPGFYKKEILFPDNLAPGLYILKAGKTLQLTCKVIVY